jgi:signal transduction histidine kinase
MATELETDLSLQGLVHDLSNVLETVNEAADLLSGDERWSSLAATIHRSVARGRRIVEGFCETACGTVELEAVLASAIESARDFLQLVHGPRVEFRTEIEPGIRLQGLPVAWERVLVNLFLNAAQAMPQGGSVEVAAQHGDGGVLITVSDSGPGIAASVLPHIFEPHFSTKPSSAGLGLHIVDSIVRQNGGSVAADNRADAPGARFSIRLPA